ncbi:DUF1003 domain-containing protein [Arvimicrobium flavum]|uniref:DUF1003 domain-containing protein n=1 Tax=Arvimicrobium flavum TaxID=3393320 RepID=UPI00237B1F15|nr:DUF1003 domain-containing protein [Mesorhizobium shangrilense]
MNHTFAELAHHWLRRQPQTLTPTEDRVLRSALERHAITRDKNKSYDDGSSTGDRVADAIARIGGSWTFIIGFLLFLLVWILINVWMFGRDTFDPYPFVFLNLVLSMLAAIQAPVIMMSQNRQAARDRLDAAHDYEVNLKAEIEIMALHEKLDELRHREVQELGGRLSEMAAQLERIEQLVTVKRRR